VDSHGIGRGEVSARDRKRNKDPFCEDREGEGLNIKKACHIGMPRHQEIPMWPVWTCGALLYKFGVLEKFRRVRAG
jgi:hypothetical protein